MLRRILSRLSHTALHLAVLAAPLPALLAPALPANAQTTTTTAATCEGTDLFRTMTPDTRDAVEAAAASVPFPKGNHWLATKGNSTIHLIGTFHIFDPRMTPHMRKLMPVLHEADKILLEATEADMAKVKKDLASKPEMLFVSGPTLPERLAPAEWEALQSELAARGIPGFLAAKFQPWYVTMILSIPPCATQQLSDSSTGLDHLIMVAAREMGTPTMALEPYDTVFQVFGAMSPDEQLESVRQALAASPMATDMLITMTEAYFREEHRLLWEMSRWQAREAAVDPGRADSDFAMMEEALINNRNTNWMERIRAEAPGRTLLVAVGAGHLAGYKGLLNLLAEDGYEIRRQDF